MKVRVLLPPQISPDRPDAAARLERIEGRSMGCGWSVTYATPGSVERARVSAAVQDELRSVVAQMSTWEADSDISRFNRLAVGAWMQLPASFAAVLDCALQIAAASGGALDPTVGALVELWGFGPGTRRAQADFIAPSGESVAVAVQRSGWRRLEWDAGNRRLKRTTDLQLDLSAVAKGFAVDAVSQRLAALGLRHHLVELGGELRAGGVKPDGQPWWVDVCQHPGGLAPITRIALHDWSVATSGDYVQKIQIGDRQYSHCIDPRSGEPVHNGVVAVTVLHAQCMQADAWATALMVLGPEQGMQLAERQGLVAQFAVQSGDGIEEHCTGHFRRLMASAEPKP